MIKVQLKNHRISKVHLAIRKVKPTLSIRMRKKGRNFGNRVQDQKKSIQNFLFQIKNIQQNDDYAPKSNHFNHELDRA